MHCSNGSRRMEANWDAQLAERVESAIRIVPDFPRPGIRFRDISPVAQGDPNLFRAVIESIAGFCGPHAPDCIVAVESWGYVFAAPVAYVLTCRLCLARRPGRLPRETFRETFDMSYA